MVQPTTYRQVVYRLLPQKRSNWQWLERTLEAQRILYNAALQERIDCYTKTGRTVTYFDQCKGLTECRKALPDMAAASALIQRGTLKRLDEAYGGFFRRKSGFPHFQGRSRWNSIAITSGVKVEGNRIRIPALGWLTIRRHGDNPHTEGLPVSAVLKREAGRWYAIVCYTVTLPEREDDGSAIGLDMNAGQVATSDGCIDRAPDMARLEARKRRYQRMVSRRRKGSRRRERAKRLLARTARRIATRRRNWQHHTSRRVSDAAHTVCIENLKPAAMTRAGKGKRGLNRVILNTGWGNLRRMLDYKAGHVIAVDPAWTSQTCAACGVIDARSRRSQAAFECVACGHADNADLNAAANIRRRGLAHLRGEGVAIGHPMNREKMQEAA